MQFSTLAVSAFIGSALAQTTTVHDVTVGTNSGAIAYSPNSVTAAVGDMVQFQFAGGNHTVTQSTFDQPCQPIAMNSNVTGFFSGFMPVAAGSTDTAAYTIAINNTTPIWVYCSQATHCQKGMNLVINVNPTKNASRTLAAYTALAAKASANLPGVSIEGGVDSTVSANSSSTGSSSASQTSSSASTSTNGATNLYPSVTLTVGGALALFMGLMM
jgi:plastocyanin